MQQVRIAGKYNLVQTIGQGGFGDVYKATETKTGKTVALKLERRSTGDMVFYEGRILQYLKDIVGIPKMFDFGFDGDFNYLAMEYCGHSLASLHTLVGGTFTLKTTLQLALKLLTILETVHNKYILHRDLKPENILFNPATGFFYLIDFGLAKRYVDKNGKHIPRLENKDFRGTLRYCTLNMHLGVENSRRDDLESFLYVLIFLLKGKLPWQNIQAEISNKAEQIKKIKMTIKIADLCQGLDEGFAELLTYVRNMGFAEFPDYGKFRTTFHKMLKKANLKEDELYDWSKLDVETLLNSRGAKKQQADSEKRLGEHSREEEPAPKPAPPAPPVQPHPAQKAGVISPNHVTPQPPPAQQGGMIGGGTFKRAVGGKKALPDVDPTFQLELAAAMVDGGRKQPKIVQPTIPKK